MNKKQLAITLILFLLFSHIAFAVTKMTTEDIPSTSADKEQKAREQEAYDEYIYKKSIFNDVKDAINTGAIKRGMTIEEVIALFPENYIGGKDEKYLLYHYWENAYPIQIRLNFRNGILSDWDFFNLDRMATTLDDMLLHKANTKGPFRDNNYKNIKWLSHTPTSPIEGYEPESDEADNRGQTDIGKVDVDKDGNDEIIKAIWGHGVSDHSLRIELYSGNNDLIGKFEPRGIQPNFSVGDLDKDGKLEVAVWGGLWDFRFPGEEGVTEETYEGHSDRHRYVVDVYKFARGRYWLDESYTTKKKYEPFCEERPH